MFWNRFHPTFKATNRLWLGALPLACVTVMACVGSLSADHGVSNPAVQARVDLMKLQKNALTVMTDMASGRRSFDRKQLRGAREVLKDTTEAIPKHFYSAQFDLHSLARAEIWSQWDDFTQHAQDAEEAVKALNTRSLAGLRRDLPALIQSCHACHQAYKAPGHEFTTH